MSCTTVYQSAMMYCTGYLYTLPCRTFCTYVHTMGLDPAAQGHAMYLFSAPPPQPMGGAKSLRGAYP